MLRRLHQLTGLFLFCLFFQGCYGLETDISKKLNFPFSISTTDSFLASMDSIIDIPGHDEIDDFVDYAVYPDPFSINEVSYKIESIGLSNTAQVVDIETFYRNAASDTVSFFRLNGVPVTPNERTLVSVSSTDLVALTNLVNNQSTFLMIVEVTGDTQMVDFTLSIYLDTTISIDYDL